MTPLRSDTRRIQPPRPIYKTADGARVPSVTTVLGVIAKNHLIQWANRLGLQGINSTEFVAEAAGAGSLTHAVIEAVLKGEVFDRERAADFTETERALARVAWRNFQTWHDAHDVGPLLLEHQLVSERLRVGGTVDLYARIDDRFCVVDFKTSNRVYDSHLLQLAAYRSLLEESGYPVQEVRVVLLPREEGVAGGEAVVVDTEPYLDVFEAAVGLYRMQAELERTERRRREQERSTRKKQEIDAQLTEMVAMSTEELAATVARIPS